MLRCEIQAGYRELAAQQELFVSDSEFGVSCSLIFHPE